MNNTLEEGNELKCTYLENQTTMVSITDFLWTLGRPSMKSIEMSAHT
jgi:hypothetical protein